MREVPNHVHVREYICLKSNVYLREEIDGIWSGALRQKGTKSGEVSSSLYLQIWESPFSDFCLFSVAFTTPRTAVSLDRSLLESDKLFRIVEKDFF